MSVGPLPVGNGVFLFSFGQTTVLSPESLHIYGLVYNVATGEVNSAAVNWYWADRRFGQRRVGRLSVRLGLYFPTGGGRISRPVYLRIQSSDDPW
jgi:hypothetical protein